MVQCGCPGSEEGWYPVFLNGLQMPQCVYEEGLVPPATDSGGPGKHGRVGAFLVDGFQVRLLADKDGPGITTVHSLYGGEPQVLRVYPHAVRAVQCTGDLSASHAEHFRGAEPHVLCHLLGQCHSLWPHRGVTPGALVHGIREVPQVQFEAQAFKVLIFPVGNRVPSPSCLTEGHPTQPGEYVGCAGISNAQDLYAGPRILSTSGALQIYQGVCQYCMPLVRHAGERSEDGSSESAPQSPGVHGRLEGKGPVRACPSVP